ncbi:MAG: cell division topological specificity factor MinE [Moorella humiferrea]|uniref:Cell division topological specificity factor n=1 Tax=Neomoorella humiferrea TaxID=676965 RepID=A0A2T0AWL9_9FIRM|nr:cell division topological specificity factor MinE [Moorella humiferrea]MBE3572599.1 cell division topological specificity factor MinE [Moorella humiferrea]PRR74987.1 Cell division topological specificity factor [Moorella humiferrea]
MLEFLLRFFGRETTSSKKIAKERLRLVLVHDRAGVSPHLLEALKNDLIKVISEYMDIDTAGLEVSLNQENDSVALVANIPILRVKRTFKTGTETAAKA